MANMLTDKESQLDQAGQLPSYAEELRAFHEAYAVELQQTTDSVPLPPQARVLDVPCGDGFFTACLARRMRPDDELVAVDLSEAYLAEAERRVSGIANGPRLRFQTADAFHLPFADNYFDVVWCAQSMISLPDPVAALGEMLRVLKPGGRVAVLENDEIHHVLFSWPVELELEIGHAMRRASRDRYGSSKKLFAARHLRTMLKKAGFQPLRRETFAADRQAPFAPSTRAYLAGHLRHTWELTRDLICSNRHTAVERLLEPESGDYLLDQPDAEATYIMTLHQGRKA